MVKLRVIARYASNTEVYVPGQEIEVTEQHAQFLRADAPGCFEVIEDKPVRKPARKRVRKPPADKAVGEAPSEK